MKRKNILLPILLSTFLLAGILTGCSSKMVTTNKDAEKAATEYVTNISNGKWDNVLKGSTGDQLAIYTQLVPSLKEAKQTSELKTADIIDEAYDTNQDLAFITVHYIRNVTLQDYGTTLDDKQVLLSMKKVDGSWKVFDMDVVTQLKTTLSQ